VVGSPRVTQLETERLVLRVPTPDDVDPLAAIYADPLVMQYIGTGQTRAREQVTHGVKWMIEQHEKHGFGLWVVETKAEGQVIGRCGLIVQEVAGKVETELAYLLSRECWGRGYATEAALEIKRAAAEALGLRRLIALIRAENAASKRVAEKLGMGYEKTVDFHGIPAELYAIELMSGGSVAEAASGAGRSSA
jgi:ribosomal-protein-alanine N-acetyltransferase